MIISILKKKQKQKKTPNHKHLQILLYFDTAKAWSIKVD